MGAKTLIESGEDQRDNLHVEIEDDSVFIGQDTGLGEKDWVTVDRTQAAALIAYLDAFLNAPPVYPPT